MNPERVQQTKPEQIFDEDKLFQEQEFNTKSTASGNTRHIIKEKTPSEADKTLCGTNVHLGKSKTLIQLAETGLSNKHPEHYVKGMCQSCIKLFEKQTGRNYRQDLKQAEVAE